VTGPGDSDRVPGPSFALTHKMKSKKRSKLTIDILRIVLVTIFFAVAAYILQLPYVRGELLDVAQWRDRSHTLGLEGFLILVGVLSLVNACGVPRTWVSAFSGVLYGALLGSGIGHLATLVGATVNFFTARWILRGPIRRRLPDRLRVWYDRFGENGFRWVFYIRLIPVGNATVVNLVSGASKMRYREFLPATFLGYLPYTVAYALFGSSAAKQKTSQLFLGAALFAAVIVGRWLVQKYRSAEGVR